MPAFTLKDLAESGYIMGLGTIGEVANHIELHYDAYWLIEEVNERSAELNKLVAGHEDDLIFKHLTAEDLKRMDDELEKAMEESPLPADFEELFREEKTKNDEA